MTVIMRRNETKKNSEKNKKRDSAIHQFNSKPSATAKWRARKWGKII